MSMVSEGEAAVNHTVKTYPLNSRRLRAETVNRIAKGLGLPTNSLLAETRQLIEGKLGEEHESKNIQVDVIELQPGVTAIKLQGKGGVIIEIPAEERSGEGQPPGRGSRSRSTSEEDVGGARGEPTAREAELMRQLESALDHECEMKLELERMQEDHECEVSELNSKIREGKEKYTALWHMNCEQLSEYDEAIASKDEELQVLRARVEGLEAHSTYECALHESDLRDGSTAGIGKHVGRDVTEGAVVPVSDPSQDLTHPLPLTFPVGEGGVPPSHATSSPRVGRAGAPPVTLLGGRGLRRGKAPPVDPFDGDT